MLSKEREKKNDCIFNKHSNECAIDKHMHTQVDIDIIRSQAYICMPINVNGETAESRVEAYEIKRDQPANTLIKFICVSRYI